MALHPTCETCRFWLRGHEHVGHCRRHSPANATERFKGIFEAAWPRTFTTDWCGDFQEKQEPASPPMQRRMTEADFTEDSTAHRCYTCGTSDRPRAWTEFGVRCWKCYSDEIQCSVVPPP